MVAPPDGPPIDAALPFAMDPQADGSPTVIGPKS